MSSPLTCLSIFYALFSPLDVPSRLYALNLLQSKSPLEDHDNSSFLVNPYRSVRKLLFNSEYQRIALLLSYVFSVLINGISCHCSSYFDKSAMSEALLTVKFLESVQILPQLLPARNWSLSLPEKMSDVKLFMSPEVNEEKQWKRQKQLPSTIFSNDDSNPDLISPGVMILINDEVISSLSSTQNNNDNSCSLYLDFLCSVLKRSSHYCLTIIQTSIYSLFALVQVILTATALEETHNKISLGENIRSHFMLKIREVCSVVSNNLLQRLENQFTEIMLIIINEEMKRFHGRKWKTVFPKMVSNRYLLFNGKARSFEPLGIDFEIPVSQVENLRKDIQTFLMIRGLYLYLHNSLNQQVTPLVNAGRVPLDEDFVSYISDRQFLNLDEMNIIPETIQENKYFDMKGKKFLDCSVGCSARLPGGASLAVDNAASTSGNNSLWSSSTSVLTLGLVNRKNSPSKSTINNGTKKSKEPERTKEGEVKVLFVQDPLFLVFVSQQRLDGKSVFKVFLVAPLLYCDAKVDLNDRCRLKVVVRSWLSQPNMLKNDSEIALSQESDMSSVRAYKSGAFLKTAEKSSFYYQTVKMETEQACSLAVQHIESRRKALITQKLEKLKTILTSWISLSSGEDVPM
jgi:hypothetical protein